MCKIINTFKHVSNIFAAYCIFHYKGVKVVKFTIGDDATCKELSMANGGRIYCNGPLKPDTWYEVKMRAFTSGGYSDSPPFKIKTGMKYYRYSVIIAAHAC